MKISADDPTFGAQSGSSTGVIAGTAADAAVVEHVADSSDAHTATGVSIIDPSNVRYWPMLALSSGMATSGNYYGSTTVEGALAEIGAALQGVGNRVPRYWPMLALSSAGATALNVATDVIWDAKGDLAAGTGSDTAARLGVGTNGQVLAADSTTATGLIWTTAGSGAVASDAIWDAIGDLAGGTGANTAARLAVGTDAYVLTADSTAATGLKWATSNDPVTDVFGAADTAYEFATTSLAGLTAIGTATAEDAHTTVPGHLYLRRAATSSVALTGRYAASPATPFTAICKLSDHTYVSANYQRAGGLFVGQATPGVMEAIHVLFNAGVVIAHERYTNPTTFAATIGTNRLISAVSFPLYYGVVVNSTTNVDFWFSFGGRVWQKRTAARDPLITIGSVGVVVDPENATYAVSGAYDFLRIWNSAKTFPGS